MTYGASSVCVERAFFLRDFVFLLYLSLIETVGDERAMMAEGLAVLVREVAASQFVGADLAILR